MKNGFYIFYILVIVIMTITSCGLHSGSNNLQAGENSDTAVIGEIRTKETMPILTFEKDFHDFGKLVSGEQVTFAFKFKNTGKSSLIISNVSTSCGCTVSSFPKKPIKPGEGATIDISFNSEGRHGFQSKSITVFTNADPPTSTLRIQSQVVEQEDI